MQPTVKFYFSPEYEFMYNSSFYWTGDNHQPFDQATLQLNVQHSQQQREKYNNYFFEKIKNILRLGFKSLQYECAIISRAHFGGSAFPFTVTAKSLYFKNKWTPNTVIHELIHILIYENKGHFGPFIQEIAQEYECNLSTAEHIFLYSIMLELKKHPMFDDLHLIHQYQSDQGGEYPISYNLAVTYNILDKYLSFCNRSHDKI